jgi:hypothetical protein
MTLLNVILDYSSIAIVKDLFLLCVSAGQLTDCIAECFYFNNNMLKHCLKRIDQNFYESPKR